MVWEINTLLKTVLGFVGGKQYKQSYLGHSSYCKHPKESLLITATHKGPGFNHGMSWSQWKEGWGRAGLAAWKFWLEILTRKTSPVYSVLKSSLVEAGLSVAPDNPVSWRLLWVLLLFLNFVVSCLLSFWSPSDWPLLPWTREGTAPYPANQVHLMDFKCQEKPQPVWLLGLNGGPLMTMDHHQRLRNNWKTELIGSFLIAFWLKVRLLGNSEVIM